jgi:polysaccharide export outer membrane protein
MTLLVLSILALALQQPSPQPSTPTAPQPGPPVEPPGRAAATQEFEIDAEDIVRIVVYGHNDLIQTVVVQSDGTFTFPLVGRVKAEGLTPKELEQKLAVLLAQGYIRSPQVSVVVQEYRSKNVFVVGEIARPGPYPLAESRTVLEILSRAGPMLVTAAGDVVVLRPKEPTKGPLAPGEAAEAAGTSGTQSADVIRVSLRDIQSGNLSQNVTLRPNDTILVPPAPKVFVSGAVKLPGAYAFSPGTTVRQAVSLAGGFTEDASTGRIKIVRQVGGKSREIKVKLDDPVQPGDTIVVKEKLF